MTDDAPDEAATISRKARRMEQARKRRSESAWRGFGMFGMVGWSISVPTIACLAIGIWIDRRWPSQYSWTLMFLFIGIVLGCLNAWYWIKRERSQIEQSSTQGRK